MLTFAQKPEFAHLMKSGSTLLAQSPPGHPVLGLQQTIGNQAVQKMLVQRQPAKDNQEARAFVEGVMWMMSESIRQYQRGDLLTHEKRHPNILAEDLAVARRWFQQASARVAEELGNDPDLQKKLSHIYRVYVYTAIDAFAQKEKRPVEALYAENLKWIDKSAAPLPTGKKWARARWNEAVAAYDKLRDNVQRWNDRLDDFEQMNGGRPDGWPDLASIEEARKKLKSISPIPVRVGDLIDKVHDFLYAHPIVDKKEDGSQIVLDFSVDPIGFLRHCESRFDDATGPLYRQWHDELSKYVQEVLAAMDEMAQAQAVADQVRAVIGNWQLILRNYKSLTKSQSQPPGNPTRP